MDVLEFDHNVFNAQQADQDKALAVRFYIQALRDDDASTREARPIYRDTEMIEIRVRGDRNNIIIRAARQDDKQRFAQAYKMFKDQKTATADGTPLSEWTVMSASMVEEMRYLGFFTVEQIAEASEMSLSKVPGMLSMKNRAKLFLDFAKGISPMEQMQDDIAKLKAASEARENNLKDQAAAYDALDKKYKALLEKMAEEA